MTSKTLAVAAFAAAVSFLTSAPSEAMPIAPRDAVAVAPQTQAVGWRCGPGWHVDPWGRCVPHRRPPPPHYGPRPGWRCGPGWHPNPWGRCVPNRPRW